MKKLEEQYILAKKTYYEGQPIMTDWDFDQLELELKRLDSDVVNIVDGDLSIGERFPHYTPMLSLEKVQILNNNFNSNETKDALINIERFLNRHVVHNYEATAKYDGVGIDLQYENGILVKALTRGGGLKEGGLNKIDKLRFLVPNEIDFPNTKVEIRGEIVIDKKLWAEKYSDPNKIDNPRNFVAGVIGKDDSPLETIQDLTVIAYHLVYDADTEPKHFSPTQINLEKMGFEKIKREVFLDIDEFEDVYNSFKQYREVESKFQIDGIVIKFHEAAREDLGETNHHPKWAVAIKFPPQVVTTKIIDIKWNVGTTGNLTPVAILQPVELDGTEVKRASLHNYSRLLETGTSINAEVEIAKKGDIIPQVIKVLKKGNENIPIPTVCECGGHIIIVNGKTEDTKNLKCINPECRVQAVGKLASAIKILKIDRIGESTCDKLYSAGIKSIIDIFNKTKFNRQHLINSGEFKDGRALDIIFVSVRNTKSIKIYQIINALKIENVGSTMSEQIGKYLSNVDYDFKGLQKDLIIKLTNENSSERELISNFIKILERANINVEYYTQQVILNDTIKIEMTGSPKPTFNTKAEFLKFIKNNNIIHSKLNKECKYLVTDSYNSNSSKMKKAEKLNVEIITYEDLVNALN